MSKSFHISPSGGISKCRATVNPCPYGGESGSENHFDSVSEARRAYEKMMKDQLFAEGQQRAEMDEFMTGNSLAARQVRDIEEGIRVCRQNRVSLDAEIAEGEQNAPGFTTSRGWYNRVQARRDAFYKEMGLRAERRKRLPASVAAGEVEKEQQKAAAKKANRDRWFEGITETDQYSFHPEIQGREEQDSLRTLSAMSGESPERIQKRINDLVELEGISRTDAHMRAWSALPIRSDKPVVALHMEVASPSSMDFDSGAYSSVIEVNMVKRFPSGTVQKKSYRCGVPENFRKAEGTGAQDVHGISPAEVEGLKPLVQDQARLDELKKDLRGTVVLSHNAKFTKGQLSHSLPGFNSAVSAGDVEMLDTMDVSRLYLRDNKDNKRDTFVESAGIRPNSEERGISIAEDTINSLFLLKGYKRPIK